MATLTVLVDGTVPTAADFNGNFDALNAENATSTTTEATLTTAISNDLALHWMGA